MFTVDSRTENFLRHMGVKYEYVDSISYETLHPNWKVSNLGRKNALDDDAILEYGTRMEHGSPAPAVIVVREGEGYLPLDGVQRLSAAETIGSTRFAGYVLSPRTSVPKQHQIRVFANAQINGQHTPEKTYILRQAVSILYFGDNCSPEEIARGCGLTTERVREEIRFQVTSRKMESIGYTGKLQTTKWFGQMLGKYADATDFETAPGPLRVMLETLERCNFRNGQSEHLVEEFFNVKRNRRKDRHQQFTHKVAALKKDPEVRARIEKRKKCSLDDVLPGLRRANTTLEKAVENDELVHDSQYAQSIAEVVRLIFVNCRKIVPRDLQYQGDRRSSIFDKG